MRMLGCVALMVIATGCSYGDRAWHPQGACTAPRPPSVEQMADVAELGTGAAADTINVAADFDGDGRRDEFVSAPHLCTGSGNCAYAAYLMRGSCGYFLGAFWAAEVRPASTGEAPVTDLIAVTKARGAKFEELYRFADGRYQCSAYRELRSVSKGRLDPFPRWSQWTGCPD